MSHFVVAIDGKGSTGTSTLAREMAGKTGWQYMNCGQFYRAFTLTALHFGIRPQEIDELIELAERTTFTMRDGVVVSINNHPVSQDALEQVGQDVPFYSHIDGVREQIRRAQHELAESCHIISEGRDLGSIVFPDASLKLHLEADDEIRLARAKKRPGAVNITMEGLLERDRLDSERHNSPLVVADGAILIDTSALTISQLVDEAMEHLMKVEGAEDAFLIAR